MTTKVIHIRDSGGPNEVLIHRGTMWGNQFSHQMNTMAKIVVPTREHAVVAYIHDLENRIDLVNAIPSLRGMTLVCFCKPKLCHGDPLAMLADNHERVTMDAIGEVARFYERLIG